MRPFGTTSIASVDGESRRAPSKRCRGLESVLEYARALRTVAILTMHESHVAQQKGEVRQGRRKILVRARRREQEERKSSSEEKVRATSEDHTLAATEGRRAEIGRTSSRGSARKSK